MGKDVEIKVKVSGDAEQKLGGLKGMLGGIGKIASGVALGGMLQKGFETATDFLSSFISEGMAAQDISAQLGAVLKSTGGAAGMTAQAVEALALGLSKTTRFEDDAIIGAETLLLGFKNIGQKTFPDATKATLDLATRLKIDLPSAAKLLGKALETPGEGLLRLKQAGVSFTDAQTDAILKMAEAGDAAGAQKMILDTLALSIGGAAEAAGTTYAGKLDILKNSFGNVKESIGGALIPALTTLATKLMEVLNSPQIQAGIANITAWLGGNLPGIIDKGLGYLTNTILPALQGALAFVSANWETFRIAIVAIGAALIAVQIAGFIASLNPLTVVIALIAGAVALFKAGWDSDWMGMRTSLQEVGANIATNLEAIKLWFTVTLPEAFNTGITWFKELPGKIMTAAKGLKEKVVGIGQSIVEGIISGIQGWWQNIKDKLWELIGGLIDWIKKLLGIASPSAVFENVGRNMVAGMAMGWSKGFGAFQETVGRSYAGMPGMQFAGGAGGGVTQNYNLTIHTQATSEQVSADFAIMRALAGV